MMHSRNLILGWLLLLIASLLIGGMAFSLLGKQQENLAMVAREADRARLATVAETINLTVSESREALATSLQALPGGDYIDDLENWRLDNPLIRNVFVWSPAIGILFPDPDRPASDEEQAFLQRYAGLFNQTSAWTVPAADSLATPAPVQARRELAELAKSRPAAASSPPATATDRGRQPQQTHWRPWFWEEGLHILIWATDSDQIRFGIELEMAALLSRLVTVLPEPADPQETWALLDDRGLVVHQRGERDLSDNPTPALSLPVGSRRPHWQIGFYRTATAVPTQQGLWWLGSVLTLILVAAILLGGSLLLWQARRNQLDARKKTSFVSNVSHELKTPLTTIRMYAEMLEEQEQLPGERRQRYLGVIGSEARRLTRLVNNLLDFSRLEQGRKQYHLQKTDLTELMTRTLAGHPILQTGSPLKLSCEQPTVPVQVTTDSDAIEQVLLNLVDNALKYAAEGQELTISLTTGEQQACIKVADRGPGITLQPAEKIFSMFQRGDDSLTTRHQGCGLGLSIARQLMRDLGGELSYQSRPGGGSMFIMTLPWEATSGE